MVGAAFLSLELSDVYSPPSVVEDGFGYILIRSPYTPYCIYLRGTIGGPDLGD